MTKKVLSLLMIIALLFSLSVMAFAVENENGNPNIILNTAFYINVKDSDFKNFSWYGDYFSFNNFNTAQNLEISVKENKKQISNMENSLDVAKKEFESFLVTTNHIYSSDIEYTKENIKKINGCHAAEFSATYQSKSADVYDEDLFFKAFVFANEKYIYCILGSSETKNLNWVDSIVKTFRMNGVPLENDEPQNDISFVYAEDYKEQLKRYSEVALDSSELGEIEDTTLFGAVFVFLIPLIIVTAIAVIFIKRYFEKKQILLQYEKSFGFLSSDMDIDTINLYLDQLKDDYNNLVDYKI